MAGWMPRWLGSTWAATRAPGSKGTKYKEANLKQRLQHLILDGFS